jgi:hypothetical protein
MAELIVCGRSCPSCSQLPIDTAANARLRAGSASDPEVLTVWAVLSGQSAIRPWADASPDTFVPAAVRSVTRSGLSQTSAPTSFVNQDPS